MLYPTAKELHAYPRVFTSIGLENNDDLNAGLDRVAALKAADLDSISPLELHHSISPNDLCPVCHCRAAHDVRVATLVSPVQIRILRARALTTRSP